MGKESSSTVEVFIEHYAEKQVSSQLGCFAKRNRRKCSRNFIMNCSSNLLNIIPIILPENHCKLCKAFLQENHWKFRQKFFRIFVVFLLGNAQIKISRTFSFETVILVIIIIVFIYEVFNPWLVHLTSSSFGITTSDNFFRFLE